MGKLERKINSFFKFDTLEKINETFKNGYIF